jgi:hypothetical protein
VRCGIRIQDQTVPQEDAMGEIRRKKQQLKKLQRQRHKASLEVNRAQRQMSAEEKKIDELTMELDASLEDWEKHPEVGDLISVLTSSNIQKHVRDSAVVQKVITGYFEKKRPFGPDGKMPPEAKIRTLRELPKALEEAFELNGADLWTTVRDALVQSGRAIESTDERGVMRAAAMVIAREAMKDETAKRILDKNPRDSADLARKGIDAFWKAHYQGLSGPALAAKEYVDRLSSELQREIKDSLERHLSKDGFKDLSVDVRRQYILKHGLPLDLTKDRTKTFERLFEIVDRTMELSNMLDDLNPEEEPEIKRRARQAIVFLTAEKIMFHSEQEQHETPKEEKKLEWHVPNTNLWSDSEITSLGRNIWERSYKLGLGDDEAARVSREAAEMWGEQARENDVLVNDQRLHVVETIGLFAGKWAVHAFQRITTTHTYAAALMCSDADREVLEDIEMQWHAFMVIIPNGLLSYEDDGIVNEYNRILVASFDGAATIALLNQHGAKSSHRIIVQMSETIAKLLDVEDVKMVHATDPGYLQDQKRVRVQRVVVLAKRMVAGLLLALQHQDNFKSKTTPARSSKNPRDPGEPAHRVVFVGKPLKVDCRPSIGDYIRNGSPKRKGAPPSVQFIVRGHYKRQVVGIGRSGRKVIWISPFWKGDTDAPILTRPKKVGG